MSETPCARPNLLLIGAQKSGTTSIANALDAHDQIFLPKEKELHFFSRPSRSDDDLKAYKARFPDRAGVKYWMDATPGYMWTRTAYGTALGEASPMRHDIPEAIRTTLAEDLRILAIMRHPVKRAVSAFFHHFRMGRLKTSDRIRDMGHRQGIIDLGFYSEHLGAYRDVFPEKEIKALFFEDYLMDTERVHKDLFLWLGLEPTTQVKEASGTNEGMKLDYSGGHISVRDGMKQINKLAGRPRYKKMKLIEPPIVEQADLDFLSDVYADELEKMAQLYEITNRIWSRQLSIETYNMRAT